MDASTTSAQGTSRRGFLTMLAMAPLAGAALSACGTSGPSSSGGGGGGDGAASMWYLSGQPNEKIKTDNLKAWGDANPDSTISVDFFQNDAYKTKIKTAIGAGQAPTFIYSWGGGTLASYAAAGQVLDLTSWFDDATLKGSVLESTYKAGTVDGKIYAYPNENAALILFYYNKKLFKQVGAEPPTTYDELLALVDTFKGAGIAPIALAGQSRWTSMMWLEYFFDRVGGPEVFDAIFAGTADAWSNPDALKALQMVQDLVKAGGFITGFESITADSNADQALLYTDKTAMMLHGSWVYSGIKNDAADFVADGNLGWFAFPPITGGKGDPKNVAGNPAQYMSVSSKATQAQQDIAKAYFTDTTNGIMSETVIDAYVASGQVCIASGIEDKIAASEDKDFLQFAYSAVQDAPSFVQSWDQALSPSTAEALLSNIDQLFSLSITPQQFADNMNATIGQ
ncbi:extracellular solute-binding protein [Quadrisphaera sp. INWT6]|uniref:extracellular solute-binding protein n=1 Tax=Quadrisphaera sp. INWT6 TaxID=2596917 RepID=UPI0018923E73|nr:extracellular solute-binding protein [Quadrisphaera sp. INWT6]MBF5080191.1 extracellular solute-binding protein [Quadrisphaera sp. INWT6]